MGRIAVFILALFVLTSFTGPGDPPEVGISFNSFWKSKSVAIAGYTKINARYEWVAGAFDSGLHVPQYNGVPSGRRSGVWNADGAIAADTANNKLYLYSGGAWNQVGSTYTFTNGLTESGGTVKLGGTLVDATTTIDINGFELNLDSAKAVLLRTNANTLAYLDQTDWYAEVGRNKIGINEDSAYIQPPLGVLKIDSLPYTLSTTGKKIMLRDTATGLVQNIDASLIGGSTAISALTAATGTNDIDNGSFQQIWRHNTLSSGFGMAFLSNSTAASGNTQTLFTAQLSGTNSSSNQTTRASTFLNTHAGTGAFNVAADFNAYNGATNYAARFQRGKVGLGTAGTESGILEINGVTSGTITIQPAAAAGTWTMTLPTDDGTSGQYLQTDGAGITSWQTVSAGGSPAGNFGNLQINRNGAFDTPASDSLDFTTGLDIKGHVNVSATSTTGIQFGGTTRIYNDGSKMRIIPSGGEVQFYTAGTGNNIQVFNSSGSNSVVVNGQTGQIYRSSDGLQIQTTSNVGIGSGVGTSATARLHISAGTATASTAPLKLTSGTNLTTAEAGAVEYDGKDLFFTPTGTIRKVIPTIISSRSTGQTAAVTSVATQTVGASDASFMVSSNILVTTSSAEAFTTTVAYTDEGNTARTLTLNYSLLAGTIGVTIAAANGAVPYQGVPVQIRCKASTTITIATTGTFTGCTYNVEGTIQKIQ